MTEEREETPAAPPEDKSKIILPEEEKKKLDKKKLVLDILGYASLVFIGLALFFPLWSDNTGLPSSISLWQVSYSGLSYYHWDVFWWFLTFDPIYLISIITFATLITIILLLVRYVWKRTFPKTGFFWVSFAFLFVYGIFFPLLTGFDFSGPLTSLYGPTWGLAFGWYALLIGGILALIRKSYFDMVEREKEEE